jgi:hypothetical protein
LEVPVARVLDGNVCGEIPEPVVDPVADPSIYEDVLEGCDDFTPDADPREPG